MQKPDLWTKLKNFDAYPKINEDFFTKTMSGGIITIVSSIVMAILFISELRLFFLIESVHELSVDTSRGEKIKINLDLNLPNFPCSWLSIDAMDISGDMHLDVDHELFKQRLSSSGHAILQAERHDVESTKKTTSPTAVDKNECGSCYGAEEQTGQCCNTCDEVRTLYRKRGWAILSVTNIAQCADDHYLSSLKEQQGEGCHVWGTLEVNKVAGNFHLAPGKSYQQGSMHVHDLAPFMGMHMDFSHTINTLSFGGAFPGMSNPLDGVHVKQPEVDDKEFHSGMYQYFLKVVPTEFTSLNGSSITTNQFSVTENFRAADTSGGRNLPGLFFFYDLSPIRVTVKQQKSEFLHFVTNVCAILGGVFTVAGIIDAFIYHSEKVIRKKMELGKFN